MSKPVETLEKTSNEVAALVKAAKEHQGVSAMLMLVMAAGGTKEAVLSIIKEYKEIGARLTKALEPFGEGA